jgi:lycopene beta-cyclase
MKEFNYIIIGGGCAGLSLAYELEIHNKLKDKTLAIIEPRLEYRKDKTWSFWKTTDHNFEDCVKKSWKNLSINIPNKTKFLKCDKLPYQSIDSGLFYEKINSILKLNQNISFYKDISEVGLNNSFIFNSVPSIDSAKNKLWQHFKGVEIETTKNVFDDKIINLMDFDCQQHGSVHFFYTLPYAKNKALVETTWLSDMSNNLEMNYDEQLKNYIENQLNIKNYKINYKENGAIPLFYPSNIDEKNKMNIGTAGCMTRLSTGYTFLNIQEHSRFIRENIENIKNVKKYEIKKKYKFLDKILLRVLNRHPKEIPNIFFKIFNNSPKTIIKFLSNKSNMFEDLLIIFKTPTKWLFIKALLK